MMVRAVLALLLVLGACTPGSDKPGAALRVDIVGSMADPTSPPGRAIIAATQMGLTGFDGRGRVVPGLATSWRVASDGRSVIFRLRDAAWADGRKATAADVVAVFRRIAAPASVNPLKFYLGTIENAAAVASGALPPAALGVEAPVENVVEVRLAVPMPELLALLATPDAAIVRSGAKPPALGPFEVKDVGSRPIELTRNARYTGTSPELDRLLLTPVDDPGAALARFARDRTDVVIGSGLAGLSEARLLGPQVLHVEASWGLYGYLVNVRAGALADPRVRRALAMAAGRDGLGQRLFGVGAMVPALGLLPPGLPSAPTPTLPDWAALDPVARREAARQLLTDAGFFEGKSLTITVTLPPGREHAAVLAAVAADWAAIGVRTMVRELGPQPLAVALAKGDFELALSERMTPVDTRGFFLAPFRCGRSAGGYCNPATDALLAAPADPPRRAATVAAVETALLADTPLIPLFVPVRWSLVQPRVTGWTDNAAGEHPLAKLGVGGAR